jgi:hypothetical protein
MNPFLKILIRKSANSENIWTLNQLPKFEFTDYKATTDFISLIKYRNNILSFTVMKSTEIYLEIPYKSRCFHYGKSENPRDPFSYDDCMFKCIRDECYVKHKCIIGSKVLTIVQSQNFTTDSELTYNHFQNKDCWKK